MRPYRPGFVDVTDFTRDDRPRSPSAPSTNPRERFTAVLFNGPLLRADAIVLLCGEDATPRIATALELLHQSAAPLIVCSGGRHEPPRYLGALSAMSALLSGGLASDRILMEDQSQHTREQAVNVVEMAVLREWRRVLLVASAYHLPRAFLAFVRALNEAGEGERIQLVAVPASASPWFRAPEGMTATRLDLLEAEWGKVAAYGSHVATYEEGLAHLAYWEGR